MIALPARYQRIAAVLLYLCWVLLLSVLLIRLGTVLLAGGCS